MDARRGTAVLIGVSLSILAPALASAAPGRLLPAGSPEVSSSCTGVGALGCGPSSAPATVTPTIAPWTEPDLPAVGARRRTSSPPPAEPGPDSGPPPVDVTPPLPEPERPAPLPEPPPPEPPAPEPAAPPPPEITPAPEAPEPAPSARAPAGEPDVQPPSRLPTTGDGRGSLYTAAAGAFLALGGLCIAVGARRRAAFAGHLHQPRPAPERSD